MVRRALLMASGANRGAYYAGFMGPIREAGLDFGILAGVSAGGIAAAWFAAGSEEALLASWREAGRWRIALHPWLQAGRFRTVDRLIQGITLKIMDLEAVLGSAAEVRLAASRITGPGFPLARLERRVFSSREIGDTAELGLVLRATAFVPWINGFGASVQIGGERYLDGGLTGRVPLEMIQPGEVDEIWVAACSPNGRRELEEELERFPGRPERLVVITPSRPLPVGRWTMDEARIFEAVELGRRDMEEAIVRAL